MESEVNGYNINTRISNFDLSYDDVGHGGTPIIFLHGFPFDKTLWLGQLDFLKSAYRCLSYDIRGFGASYDETSSFSIDLFSDDLIAFMDKLSIEKAIVCGLSMGGFIALNAQKRFPDRFEALILCDTQCIADTVEVKVKRYQAIEEIESQGGNNFNEGFIRNVFYKDSLQHKKEIVGQVCEVVCSNSKHILTMGLNALAERAETCSTLGRIDIPTLIICGREDMVTPLAESRFLHKHIKGSTLCIIDDAGHLSNLEQPYEFNKHLYDFLITLKGVDIEVALELEAY